MTKTEAITQIQRALAVLADGPDQCRAAETWAKTEGPGGVWQCDKTGVTYVPIDLGCVVLIGDPNNDRTDGLMWSVWHKETDSMLDHDAPTRFEFCRDLEDPNAVEATIDQILGQAWAIASEQLPDVLLSLAANAVDDWDYCSTGGGCMAAVRNGYDVAISSMDSYYCSDDPVVLLDYDIGRDVSGSVRVNGHTVEAYARALKAFGGLVGGQ